MSYDYKIINVDPTLAFVKRVLLYVAMLIATVALAFLVMLILFERYLSLLLPGAMIVISCLILFLTSRKITVFTYTFTDRALKVISGNRREYIFDYSGISIDKNAKESDFIDKSIIKLSFTKRRIYLKNAANDNTSSLSDYIISYENKSYLVSLDDYALAIIKGAIDG